jgi:hypothetical protein
MKKVMGRVCFTTFFNNAIRDSHGCQSYAVRSSHLADDKPIAFYKPLPCARYTTTERELLSIVETLKEFRNILRS